MSGRRAADCRTAFRWSKRAALPALVLFACAHPARAPLQPDRDAIAETRAGDDAPLVSARAYRHYLDALLARNAEDYATAAAELREALIHDPESPHLRTVLAEVLLKQGHVAEAEAQLAAALAADPHHAPALVAKARIAIARGDFAQGHADLEAAIDAQPDEPGAYRDLAHLLLAQDDASKAEKVAGRLESRLRNAQDVRDDDPDAIVAADRIRDDSAAAWVEV